MKKKKQTLKEMLEMIKEFPITPMQIIKQHSDWMPSDMLPQDNKFYSGYTLLGNRFNVA